MPRFHLIATTDADSQIEVELGANDAADAVARLVELLQYSEAPTTTGRPAWGVLSRIYVAPLDD